jgi:hypothetical protein
MPAKKYRRTFTSRIMGATYGVINRFVPWHRLPVVLSSFNLNALRDALREKNLYDTNTPTEDGAPPPSAPPPPHARASAATCRWTVRTRMSRTRCSRPTRAPSADGS